MFSLAYNVITVLKQEITVRRVIINGLKNNNLKKDTFKKKIFVYLHITVQATAV